MKYLDINSRLRSISCPFTWRMESILTAGKIDEQTKIRFQRVIDMREVFPESILIYHLMQAYEDVRSDDLSSAMQRIDEAEQSLADIREKGSVSKDVDVLHRMFVGTKSHALQSLGRQTEVEELLGGIPRRNPNSKMKLAMLSGCQCIALTIYAVDHSRAISCAEKAIEYDPGNGKWYFLLGKNYRRARRRLAVFHKAPAKELAAFQKAYILHRNISFGMSLARTYREVSTNIKWTSLQMAMTIYMEIKALQPTCYQVQLHLALGFIRFEKKELAKQCLDYVATKVPDDVRYIHYMGLYYEKCEKDFEAAFPFYKISSEKLNYASERQYLECRIIVEPEWDPLPYMLNLLKKYENRADYIMQAIYTEIGLYFLLSMHDVPSACKYLYKAIEIQPEAGILKFHIPALGQSPRINTYKILETEVKFALEAGALQYNDDTIAMLKNTLAMCRKNRQNTTAHDALSSPVQNPGSQSFQNHIQSLSPLAETVVGAQKLKNHISRGISSKHCQLNNSGIDSAIQGCLRDNGKPTEVSCPFTWDIGNIVTLRNRSIQRKEDWYQRVLDMQEVFPECILIYHLTRAYEDVKRIDLPSAMQSIDEAEQSFADIKEKATLKDVENVLQHIYVQTKFRVLQSLGRLDEADELLTGSYTVKDFRQDNELATLSGCECLAWSIYATNNLEAITCAAKAVQYAPGNGKWHFLLGENCRRLRRYEASHHKPYFNELEAFERAYILSANPLFAVSLAQSYWESSHHSMANEIYKKIYALQPTSCQVQLQLALGFILSRESELAKDCLDYVAERMPDSLRYTHYMGIYEEKCNKDFKAALSYYEMSTEKSNYAAERCYIICRKRQEPDWNPLPYILGLLEKYHEYADDVILTINTEIGLYYLLELDDVLSACQYLTKADEIQPNSSTLKSYLPLLSKPPRVNVYEILGKKVQSTLETDVSIYDEDTIAMFKNTLQLCRKTTKYAPPAVATYSQKRQNLELSSGHQKYGQGLTSSTGTGMSPGRAFVSFSGSAKDHPTRGRGFKHHYSNTFYDIKESRSSTSNWRLSNSC